MFWHTDNDLEEDGSRDAVRAAATRAIHAVFREMDETPQIAIEVHGLKFSTAIEEAEIAYGTRRGVNRNWEDYLLTRILAPTSVGRASNCSYSVKEILAPVAQAALINELAIRETGRRLLLLSRRHIDR